MTKPSSSDPLRARDDVAKQTATSALSGSLPTVRDSSLERDPGQAFLALDSCGKFALALHYDSNKGCLAASLMDRDPAFKSDDTTVTKLVSTGLRIQIAGVEHSLECSKQDSGSALIAVTPSQGTIEAKVTLFGQDFISLRLDTTDGTLVDKHHHRLLHAYDLRNLAVRGEDYIETLSAVNARPKYRPLVDLHTHYGGQIASETLVRVAREVNLNYPIDLLRLAGITRDFGSSREGTGGALSLNDLTPDELGRLTASMHIEPTEVITFEAMELVYKLRSPITKDPELLPAFLEDIAIRYRDKGVQYAELSSSAMVDPVWLRKAHECLPEIEQRTGVQLRFLVGLWRHSPEHHNLDLADQAMFAAKFSPYIVGVDFMGHETNSTLTFRDVISSRDPWNPEATLIDPRTGMPREDGLREFAEKHANFQIRVHAGENPLHPENVREAVNAGATRIGHGLYGAGEPAVRELLKKNGVIVEFNPNSNRALNNVDGLDGSKELPITEYVEDGIAVSLGTDGDIYRAGGIAETYVAHLSGLSPEKLIEIARADLEYKRKMRSSFVENWNAMICRCIDNVVAEHEAKNSSSTVVSTQALRSELEQIALAGARGPVYHKTMTEAEKNGWSVFEKRILKAGNYGLPLAESFPRSTFDWGIWVEAKNSRVASLTSELAAKGITMHSEEGLDQLFRGRTPILVSGASASSWRKITDTQAVKTFLKSLVEDSDPAKVVFVTGATHFGVEEELHQIIKADNQRRREAGLPTFSILGTVVEETIPNELGPITDAVLLGERWYSKSGRILNIVKEREGTVIFIGGGNILNDEIQAAWNIRSNFYLMDGPEGASTTKVASHPAHGFTTYEDFREKRGKEP